MSDPVVVKSKLWPKLNDWNTLVEVRPESVYGSQMTPAEPVVTVLQHNGTGEIRVDIFNCQGGLDVTFTNGGVDKEGRRRNQRWFRDIRTRRDCLSPLTVRFMAPGDVSNVEIKS